MEANFKKHYSAEEELKIEKLRQALKDIPLSEKQSSSHFLIRWLKARKFDVGKAELMLRASLKWRAQNKIDTILEDEKLPSELEELAPLGFFGISKDGYGIYITPLSKRNPKMDFDKWGEKKMQKLEIMAMELQTKQMEKTGTIQNIDIVDMDGYSITQILYSKQAIEYFIRIQNVLDANYPETSHSIVVLNAPYLFSFLWNILKPLISKETAEKVQIYGYHEIEKWKKIIREKYQVENIPPKWGGTMQGVDEFCSGHPSIWLRGGNFNLNT